MSLIRQWGLSLTSVLVLVLVGALCIDLLWARDLLQSQLRQSLADGARAMAVQIVPLQRDRERIGRWLEAQAATGAYRVLRFEPADGTPPIEQRRPVTSSGVPGWFRTLMPIEPAPGSALVTDGREVLGRLWLAGAAEAAYRTLWGQLLLAASWTLALALAAVAGIWLASRRLQAALRVTADPARTVTAARPIASGPSATTEQGHLAQATYAMVERVRGLFEAQAAQAEQWRRQAQLDPLTGLTHRTAFLGHMTSLLKREDGADGGGLVLVRLADLDGLNRRLGRVAVDGALRAVAAVLQTYTDRVPDCLAGRLNGADFALFVPVRGLAAETAASLAAALGSSLRADAVAIHVGAVEAARGVGAGALMAHADLALAHAEIGDPIVPEVIADESAPVPGEGVWREQLLAALDESRTELVAVPVLGTDRRLTYLACSLRLRLDAVGPPVVAARWLPLAVRSRLTPALDREAVRLALAAIAADGRPRGVVVTPASLADPEFAAQLSELVQSAPQPSRSLWLALPEAAAVDRPRQVQELARRLRSAGVRLGLVHAGQNLHRIERLYALALDFVTLDAAVCTGVAASSAAQAFVRSTVQLLAALSVRVHAEGVGADDDANTLRDCGIVAIGGPWAGEAVVVD